MAKLTIDQRIAKVNSQIQKEEEAKQESKEKIKKLTAELKLLTAEKEQSFANDIIKLMKANGLSQEQLMAQLKGASITATETAVSSSSESASSVSTASDAVHGSTES